MLSYFCITNLIVFYRDFYFSAVYSNANQDVINPLLYQGLIEEVVEVLQIEDDVLIVSFIITTGFAQDLQILVKYYFYL